jgi:hypothetical protein
MSVCMCVVDPILFHFCCHGRRQRANEKKILSSFLHRSEINENESQKDLFYYRKSSHFDTYAMLVYIHNDDSVSIGILRQMFESFMEYFLYLL